MGNRFSRKNAFEIYWPLLGIVQNILISFIECTPIRLSVVQQNVRVTRWIVLPFLQKRSTNLAVWKDFAKGQIRTTAILLVFYWVTLIHFYVIECPSFKNLCANSKITFLLIFQHFLVWPYKIFHFSFNFILGYILCISWVDRLQWCAKFVRGGSWNCLPHCYSPKRQRFFIQWMACRSTW